MIDWWWSWLLAGIGLTGLWLAGNHNVHGWRIGVAVQVLWITYAIVTRQWGFIASALAFGFVNGRNLMKWQRQSTCDSNSAQPSHDLRPDNAKVTR